MYIQLIVTAEGLLLPEFKKVDSEPDGYKGDVKLRQPLEYKVYQLGCIDFDSLHRSACMFGWSAELYQQLLRQLFDGQNELLHDPKSRFVRSVT